MSLRLTVQKRARILASFVITNVHVQNTILSESVLHVANAVPTIDGRSHDVERKSAIEHKIILDIKAG